ncbi:MAG TPA: DUF58 domain-containing protein [Bryobacteraceae bacterium]|nr:DUF58 domain-containing protein [Bryobacteraceae bacterium]
MLRIWSRIHSSLDIGMRQQVTRLGLLFTMASVIVALGAFASANNLLFLILAIMLATFMVSGFISRLSLAGLELDFLLPEHISARRKLFARIVIRNTKGWMPSFSIHVTASGDSGLSFPLYFPVIPGGARVEEPVELLFSHRGSYRQNSFRFSTRFPFGFTERRINVPLLREVLIYPSVDPQPGFEDLLLSLEGEIASFYRGQGHDFYRIRPYEVLESARHVDWKATAHTGDLQVREFAREKEQAVAFFLDLDVPGNHAPWFETAVDRCAFLAWNMSQRGSRVRFCTQDVDWQLPEEADVYTILKYLALVFPRPGKPLSASNDRNVFQIIFSASPERLPEAGWELSGSNVRLLGPDTVEQQPAPPATAQPEK